MAIAALILMNVVYAIGCVIMQLGTFMSVCNLDKFYAEIQKLVRANNIDRAIKICNGMSELCLLPKHCKKLLVRANRPPEEIDGAKDEAIFSLDEITIEKDQKAWYITALANITTLAFLLYLAASGSFGGWHILLVTTGYLMAGNLVVVSCRLPRHARQVKTKIVELRNLLVTRQRGR
jgi:hypothetical protein